METITPLKYNIDLSNIGRNSYISERQVNKILNMNHEERYYGLAKLELIQWLQKQVDQRLEDGDLDEQLIVKQEDWGIIFLGGIDAVRYCANRTNNHIKNAKKQNNRIFQISPNDIDTQQRDEYQHYLNEARIRDKILNKSTTVYC